MASPQNTSTTTRKYKRLRHHAEQRSRNLSFPHVLGSYKSRAVSIGSNFKRQQLTIRMRPRSNEETNEANTSSIPSTSSNNGDTSKAGGSNVDVPYWIQKEKERDMMSAVSSGDQDGIKLPWPLYLVFSVIVGIAAVRCKLRFIFLSSIISC